MIAERAEKEEQLACLREHGCEQVQGTTSESLLAEAFLQLLERGKELPSASVRY